jgi:hypothetical protein
LGGANQMYGSGAAGGYHIQPIHFVYGKKKVTYNMRGRLAMIGKGTASAVPPQARNEGL